MGNQNQGYPTRLEAPRSMGYRAPRYHRSYVDEDGTTATRTRENVGTRQLLSVLRTESDEKTFRSRSALDEIKSLQYLKLSTEPRRDFQYNNLNYTVLAEIVTTLSGVSFTNFVKDRLFLPIGMNTATYDVPAAESGGRLVRGYTRSGRDLVSCRKKSLDEGGLSGSEMFDKMQLSDCIGKARDTGVHPGDHDSHLGSVGLMCSSLDLVSLESLSVRLPLLSLCISPWHNEYFLRQHSSRSFSTQ